TYSESNCKSGSYSINTDSINTDLLLFDLSSPVTINYPKTRITKGLIIPYEKLKINHMVIPTGKIQQTKYGKYIYDIISSIVSHDKNLDLKIETIINLLNFYLSENINSKIIATKRQQKIFEDAQEIIKDNILNVNLNYVANQLYISRSTLQSAFSVHNTSFIKTLTDIRIERIKMSLSSTENINKKISTICNEAGYSSISNASKQFKLTTGLSFAEFKNSCGIYYE
ncbi:helix-turn-helix domain-containing protein, partial [Photobacterium kishitanii]